MFVKYIARRRHSVYVHCSKCKFADTNKDIVCKNLQSTKCTSMRVQVSSNKLVYCTNYTRTYIYTALLVRIFNLLLCLQQYFRCKSNRVMKKWTRGPRSAHTHTHAKVVYMQARPDAYLEFYSFSSLPTIRQSSRSGAGKKTKALSDREGSDVGKHKKGRNQRARTIYAQTHVSSEEI